MRLTLPVTALLVVAWLSAVPPALASPGPLGLDPSFGEGGVAQAHGSIPGYREAGAVAVAPDGKILVAGNEVGGQGAGALVRFQADGGLDTGFAGAGYRLLPGIGTVDDLAVDGFGDALLLSNRTTLTRVTPMGELDPAFGDQGSVQLTQLDPRFTALHFWALALQPDGGILVAGIRFGSPRMVVVRLHPDGSLDRSFGDGGLVTLSFGRGMNSGAFQVMAAPDGRIVLGGYAGGAPAIACLLPDGRPDPSFNGDGRLRAPLGLRGGVTALAVGLHGGIFAAGAGWKPGEQAGEVVLLRFGLRGRLDRGFGTVAAADGGRPVATPVAILRVFGGTFVITRGRGPGIRAYTRLGRPGEWLGGVPGVPQHRFFGTVAAGQLGRIVLAWTPRHRAGEGTIELERFSDSGR